MFSCATWRDFGANYLGRVMEEQYSWGKKIKNSVLDTLETLDLHYFRVCVCVCVCKCIFFRNLHFGKIMKFRNIQNMLDQPGAPMIQIKTGSVSHLEMLLS